MKAPAVRPSVEQLKQISLLSCFKDAELDKLLRMGHGYAYEAHANVMIEGEQTWGLYLLLDGMVGIYKTNSLTGGTYDVAHLSPGSFFGEMSLIDDKPRSATVRALTDIQVFNITKEAFGKFLASSPDLRHRFYESVIRHLVARLRDLDQNYVVSQFQLWKTALSGSSSARVAKKEVA